MFWWRRSLACPDAGRTGGFSIRPQSARTPAPQNRAANLFSGAMLCNGDRCSRKRASLRRVGPSGFPARLAQRVLEVGDRLLVLRYGRGFLVNFRFGVGQVLPVVLFPHRCVRVAVLLLLQIVFPLQDVEFVSVVREFLSCVSKGFPPIRFVLD